MKFFHRCRCLLIVFKWFSVNLLVSIRAMYLLSFALDYAFFEGVDYGLACIGHRSRRFHLLLLKRCQAGGSCCRCSWGCLGLVSMVVVPRVQMVGDHLLCWGQKTFLCQWFLGAYDKSLLSLKYFVSKLLRQFIFDIVLLFEKHFFFVFLAVGACELFVAFLGVVD